MRFAEGLASLAALGCTHLLELGPQPVLCGFARVELPQLPALPSLVRPRAGEPAERQNWANLLGSLAQLWRDGARVDWAGYGRPYHLPVADAPTYPFQRQRYWFSAATPARETLRDDERIELASGAILVRGRLDPEPQPFLLEHVVLGETIVPGASHLVALLAASGMALRDIVFAAPLRLPPEGCGTQILQTEDRIELFADVGGSWRLHASATIEQVPPLPPPLDIAAITARLVEDPNGPAALYKTLADRDIVLGPAFRNLRRLFRGDGERCLRSRHGTTPHRCRRCTRFSSTPHSRHLARLSAKLAELSCGGARPGRASPIACRPARAHVHVRPGAAGDAEIEPATRC